MSWIKAAADAVKVVGSYIQSGNTRDANNQQAENTQRAIEAIRQIMQDAYNQEVTLLEEGNTAAAAAIRAAAAAELEAFAAILAEIPGMKEEVLGIVSEYKEESIAFYQPFIADKMGADAARNYQNAMLGLPNLDGTPNEWDADIITDRPSFRFREEQGFKAADRSAAARTGTLGGRAVRESQRFASGLASQEFEAEFNRAGNLGNALTQSAQFGTTGAANATGVAGGQAVQAVTGLNSKVLAALGGIGDANAREQRDLGSLALDNAGNRIQLSQNRSNALVNTVGASIDAENQRVGGNALARNNFIGDVTQTLGGSIQRFGGSSRGGGTHGTTVSAGRDLNGGGFSTSGGGGGANVFTKPTVQGTGKTKTRIGDKKLSQRDINALGIY